VDLLDIDRAHRILTAGEADGSATALPTGPFSPPQGWDYVPTLASGASVHWTFRVSQPIPEMSVVATWYRQVATNFTTTSLQDGDLKLWRVVKGAPAAISGDAGVAVFGSGNCESASTIDNIEHLYLRNLAVGDYVLELKRKTGTQPAMPITVAWYLPTTFPTGDINQDGVVGAPDLAELLGQWGGAGSADLNGDGIVNASDLGILLANWG
ncbi:MAG: dockerin type I domain-containing protein, partial [Planctomycetota bacterium]